VNINTIAPVWEQGCRVIGPHINAQGTHHPLCSAFAPCGLLLRVFGVRVIAWYTGGVCFGKELVEDVLRGFYRVCHESSLARPIRSQEGTSLAATQLYHTTQNLLALTCEPISLISQAVGFCDQSHFGMVFRKLVGATPLAYRRQSAQAREIDRPGVLSSHIAVRAMEAPCDPFTTTKKDTVAINDGAMIVRYMRR